MSLSHSLRSLRPALAILVGASVVLSLSMGLRQSLGIFMPPITRDVGMTVSQFTLAIAVQNLCWGVLQPLAGALAVRVGYRPLMLTGAVIYLLAMAVLAAAGGSLAVTAAAGVLVGVALACTGSAITMSVAARAVPAAQRSLVLGMVSAAGSLGAMIAAPIGQVLAQGFGWRAGVLGFLALAAFMLPAAWSAGRGDSQPAPATGATSEVDRGSARQALGTALRTAPFVIMALAYFVCGMQLVFLTTHLPSYLAICGMDPMLSAQVLGVIGGFNVVGSLFFGWAGGRWNKMVLLGLIYMLRSVALAVYFMSPPTPAGTLVFGAVMGFLWLGVAPLVAGSVADLFGLRWQAMIQGMAFFSHQMGSVLGAYGGGLLYDMLGSYELAWRFGVGLGLAAGAVQILAALARPPAPHAGGAPA